MRKNLECSDYFYHMLNCQNNIFWSKITESVLDATKKLCNSRVIRAEPVAVGSYFFDTLPYRQFLKNCPTTFHPEFFFRTCPLSGRGKAQFVLHEAVSFN